MDKTYQKSPQKVEIFKISSPPLIVYVPNKTVHRGKFLFLVSVYTRLFGTQEYVPICNIQDENDKNSSNSCISSKNGKF